MEKRGINLFTIIICISIFIGVVMLFIGLDYEEIFYVLKNGYVMTDAIFDTNVSIEPERYYYTDGNGQIELNRYIDTYKLKYFYYVDGKKYVYTTKWSTNVLPKDQSRITIFYNPNNPVDVIYPYINYNPFIAFGICFIIEAVGFFIMYKQYDKSKKDEKEKHNVLSTYIFLVNMLIIEYTMLYITKMWKNTKELKIMMKGSLYGVICICIFVTLMFVVATTTEIYKRRGEK